MIALVILAGLMILLLARLVGLRFPRLISLLIARRKWLRLHRNKARLGAEIRKAFALVVAVIRGHFLFVAGLRLVLAKLFLSSRNQPEIMLGMLVIILRCHRISRTSRIARQLDVFFRNVGRGATNLDIGSVGLENPGHRVLATPVVIVVIIIAIVVPVTHPLIVILTVSHVSPFLSIQVCCCRRSARRGTRGALPSRNAVHLRIDFAVCRVQQRRVPQPPAYIAGWTKSFSLPKQAQVFSREFPSARSGFRSLCGRKQRSSLSHRAQYDLPFGTFHSGGLSLSELWPSPVVSMGPVTPDRCCGRNVIAPEGYSK